MENFDHVSWIREGLKKAGRNQSDLARLLEVDPSQITRMMQGGRKLSPDEAILIAEFLRLPIPSSALKLARAGNKLRGVKVVGMLSSGLWRDARAPISDVPDAVGAVIDDRYPVEEQTAYRVVSEPAMSSRLQAGDFVIVVPFSRYRSRPLPGDIVVRELRREELLSHTLVRCTRDGLFDMMTGEAAPDDSEFVGLYVGFHGTSI